MSNVSPPRLTLNANTSLLIRLKESPEYSLPTSQPTKS